MHVAGYTLHLGDFEGDGPDTVQGRLGALSGFYDHGLDVGAVFGWIRTTTRSACTRGGGLVPPDGEVVVTPITASDRVKRRDRLGSLIHEYHRTRRGQVRRGDEPVQGDVLRRADRRVHQRREAPALGRPAGLRLLADSRPQSVVRRSCVGSVRRTPPPLARGKSPTGPLALGNPDHVHQILRGAGFTGIRVDLHAHEVDVPESAVIDDVQLAFMGVGADAMDPQSGGLPDGAFRDRRRNAPIPFGVSNRHCSPIAASNQLPHLSANLGAGAYQYAGSAHVSEARPDNPMRITTCRCCDGLFSIASLEPKISRYPRA